MTMVVFGRFYLKIKMNFTDILEHLELFEHISIFNKTAMNVMTEEHTYHT